MIHSRYNLRQRTYAILLLMVMLMQLGTKVCHLHQHSASVELACSDCDHHRVHSGHLMAWDGHESDCLVCQLLANPYLEPQELGITPMLPERCCLGVAPSEAVAEAMWCVVSPRGPPANRCC